MIRPTSKKHERLKQEVADREAKDRKESEDRQKEIKRLWDLKEQDLKAGTYKERKLKERDLKDRNLETILNCLRELAVEEKLVEIVNELREKAHLKTLLPWTKLCVKVADLIHLADLQDREIEYLMQFRAELETIRKFYPEQFESLSSASASADLQRLWAEHQSLFKKYRKPGKSWDWTHRKGDRFESIEFQFGGDGEARWRRLGGAEEAALGQLSWPLSWLLQGRSYKRTCLDKILSGEVKTLNMQELLNLFYPVPRDRLSKILKDLPRHRKGQKTVYPWDVVPLIMKALLNEEPKKGRWAGGRAARIWLSGPDPELRTRVLTGVEARINTLWVPQDIKSAFLNVIHAHLL